MIPFDIGTPGYELGPQTALTPKQVAHGSMSNIRILKANPIGFIEQDGRLSPYFSARMEHYHQPVEHAMLGTVSIDHFGLGQTVPHQAASGKRRLQPSAQFSWPDTSPSSGFSENPLAGSSHPIPDWLPGMSYYPRGGQG